MDLCWQLCLLSKTVFCLSSSRLYTWHLSQDRAQVPTAQNPESSAVTHKTIVKSKESKTAKLHVYFSSLAALCRDVIK